MKKKIAIKSLPNLKITRFKEKYFSVCVVLGLGQRRKRDFWNHTSIFNVYSTGRLLLKPVLYIKYTSMKEISIDIGRLYT